MLLLWPLWTQTHSKCCFTIANYFSFFIFCFSFIIFHFLLSIFQFCIFLDFSISCFHFSIVIFRFRILFPVFRFFISVFAFCFTFFFFRFFCIVVLRQASSARRPSYLFAERNVVERASWQFAYIILYYIILYKVCTPYNTMHVYLRIITSSSKVCWRFC